MINRFDAAFRRRRRRAANGGSGLPGPPRYARVLRNILDARKCCLDAARERGIGIPAPAAGRVCAASGRRGEKG